MQAWLEHKKPNADGTQTFPAKLDNQQPKAACQTCFSEGLEVPVNNPNWYKASDSDYFFSRNGDHNSPDDFQENGDFYIHYEASTGALTSHQIVK